MWFQWSWKVITLRHGHFPVNVLHIFRIPFTKNTSGWLLLELVIVVARLMRQPTMLQDLYQCFLIKSWFFYHYIRWMKIIYHTTGIVYIVMCGNLKYLFLKWFGEYFFRGASNCQWRIWWTFSFIRTCLLTVIYTEKLVYWRNTATEIRSYRDSQDCYFSLKEFDISLQKKNQNVL